jgi:hypothetical protein
MEDRSNLADVKMENYENLLMFQQNNEGLGESMDYGRSGSFI